MKHTLRPYQQQTIDSIVNAKSNKVITELATGLGKSFIAASMITQRLKKHGTVLFLAHRTELLDQMWEELKEADPTLRVGIEMGDDKVESDVDVICGSVQTLGRANSKRIQKFDPHKLIALIVDEVHLGITPGYVNVYEYFGLNKNGANWNKEALLWGMSGTAFRTKPNETLRSSFDELTYSYGIVQAIKDGWLCNLRGIRIHTESDISKVKTSGGDFIEVDLANQLDSSERNQLIVDNYLKYGKGKQTLVFSINQLHSQNIKKKFEENGIDAYIIDSNTKKDIRKQLVKDFKANKINILINTGTLTTGFNVPAIELIILARPTKSKILLLQCVGRGTRLHPGKKYCTVVDLVDCYSKNDLMNIANTFDLPQQDEIDVKYEAKKTEEAGLFDIASIAFPDTKVYTEEDLGMLVKFAEKVQENVLKKSRYTWMKIGRGAYFLPMGKEKLVIQELWESYELFYRDRSIGKFTVKELDAKVVEILNYFEVDDRFLVRGSRSWHKQSLSEAQSKFIRGLFKQKGQNVPMKAIERLNKRNAGNVISLLKYK